MIEPEYIGNYQLIQQLGKGAFGTVYLAEHILTHTQVAVKVLPVGLTDHDSRTFLNEIRHMHLLQSHPHIVPILDMGISNKDVPFLVMEYVAGGPLHKRHPRGSKLPAATIVNYVEQLASALQYAHDHQIIHRDVKPENILLRSDGTLLLSDFGIAKMLEWNSLKSIHHTQMVGTPVYMAPEQSLGKPDFASDQYSLAVIVYEWLSGTRPFLGGPMEVIAQHRDDPPPSLCAICPEVSSQVEQIIFKALAKTPAKRFTTVTQFAQTLCAAMRKEAQITEIARKMTLPPVTLVTLPLADAEVAPPLAAEPIATNRPLIIASPTSHEQMNTPHLTTPPAQQEQADTQTKQPQNLPAPLLTQTAQQLALARIKQFWIEGVLTQSLHMIATQQLEATGAEAFPHNLTFLSRDGSLIQQPAETRIIEIYDHAQGNLLIIGETGTGKTTLLLELAQDLILRSEQNLDYPLPLVCSLISWAKDQLSIETWLTSELITRYGVALEQAQRWMIQPDAINPLFDDFDQVPAEKQQSCIDALAAYWTRHPDIPMITCTQNAQLFPPERFPFQFTIHIQPFTKQQIETYLLGAGKSLYPLHTALFNGAESILQNFPTTQLMLCLLILTYQQRKSARDLLMVAPANLQNHIYTQYIRRMLSSLVPNESAFQDSIRVLQWLARLIQQQHIDFFSLSHIKYAWLDEQLQQKYKDAVSDSANQTGFWITLILSLILGLVVGLVIGRIVVLNTNLGVWGGIWIGIGSFIATVVIEGIIITNSSSGSFSQSGFWTTLILSLILGLVVGLVISRIVVLNTTFGVGGGIWIGIGSFIATVVIEGIIITNSSPPGISPNTICDLTLLKRSLKNAGYLPNNDYQTFLDDAVQCHLLHKLGDDYRFVHPLLQDYFASDASLPTP